MTLIQLENKVTDWAESRGLLGAEANPFVQFARVVEETGEIASALCKRKPDALKDGIGDVIVTLIVLARQKGTNIRDCLEIAYEEISKREGKMVGGSYIKDSDL